MDFNYSLSSPLALAENGLALLLRKLDYIIHTGS
jgi:hypothetical protein